MEIKNLKNISISNLILIILNDKNIDILRKCAEVELRKRIKNVGWKYDDLLHFDDKVIKQRGLDVENYLISPNVNMQQLLETYFKYCWQKDYNSNGLLFSEKHLCNEANFAEPFFSKICKEEIKNIRQRLEKTETTSQEGSLLTFKQLLEEREEKSRQDKQEIFREHPTEILSHNDALFQFYNTWADIHDFLQNYSDEKLYKVLSSKLKLIKASTLYVLHDVLSEFDMIQNLYGLKFIKKDSSKLNTQKRLLLHDARRGFEVNYETEEMQRVLQRINKNN